MTTSSPRDLAAALGLMLGPAVALGLGRFAYALVLPSMRVDLGWSFTTAGALNTANALGYLAGAPLAAALARRVGERRAFLVALVITALTVLACAASGDLVVLLVLRVAAGVSGAVVFVVGAGLVAQAGRGNPSRGTLLLSVYFAGGGVGVLLSALLVPVALGAGGWRAAWLVLGGVSLLCLIAAVPAARAVPQTERGDASARGRPDLRPLSALLACFLLFGAGYIAYMTFVVAGLEAAGADAAAVTVFWALLGCASLAAAVLWARVLPVMRPELGLILVLVILTVGAALPALHGGVVASATSAILFGGTFLAVVTAITAVIRRVLPPGQWTSGISAATTAFALGQCIGPLLSGALSDTADGIRLGLASGAVLLVLATLVAVALAAHARIGRRPWT